jgi:hypothetical protein
MNKFLLLELLVFIYLTRGEKLSAQLYIIAYNPLYLNLSFSRATPLPKFQLLFNEIPINYSVDPCDRDKDNDNS